MTAKYLQPLIAAAFALSAVSFAMAGDGDIAFRHHYVSRDSPITDTGIGDYGLTALLIGQRIRIIHRDVRPPLP